MKKFILLPLVGVFCLNFIPFETSIKYDHQKKLKSISIDNTNKTEEISISPNVTPTVLVTSVVFATVLSVSVCLTIGGPPKPAPPKPEDPKDPTKKDPNAIDYRAFGFNGRHFFIDKNLYLFNLD